MPFFCVIRWRSLSHKKPSLSATADVGVRSHTMKNMRSKLIVYVVFVVGFILQPVFCFASSLVIKIDSPTKSYKKHHQFKLLVTFSNISKQSFIVFPAYIRREYTPLDSQSSQYSPYPGPVIDPWRGAISLKPGQSETVTYDGMRDGDGVWSLMAGRYKLAVRLNVLPNNYDYSTPNKKIVGTNIWLGNIKSESININYLYGK